MAYARRGGLHPLLLRRTGRRRRPTRFYGDVEEVVAAGDRSRPAVEPVVVEDLVGSRRARSPTSTARSMSPPSSTATTVRHRPTSAADVRLGHSARAVVSDSASTPPAVGCRPATAAAVAGLHPWPAAPPPAPPPRRRGARGWRTGRGRGEPSSIAARTAQPGSWSCLQSRNRQWSISSKTSAKARSMPSPDSHRLSARTPGVSISQPLARAAAAARRRRWCAGRAGRPCAPRWSPARREPSRALTSVDLPTPLAPRNASVRPPAANARSSSMPSPGVPAGDEHGHAERRPRRARGGAGSGSSTRSALVSTTTGSAPLSNASTSSRSSRRWFGGVAERVGEEDDVDVGGERVGLGAGALERRPADERRPARQHVVDALAVVGRARPSRRRRRRRRCCAPVGRWPASVGSAPPRTVLQPRSSRDDPSRATPGAPRSLPRRRRSASSQPSGRAARRCRPPRQPATASVDLVDEAPRQRRGGVDHAIRSAPGRPCGGGRCAAGCSTVPPAPGTRPEAELGEGDAGVGRGDDVARRTPAPRCRRPCRRRAGGRAGGRRAGGRGGPGCGSAG